MIALDLLPEAARPLVQAELARLEKVIADQAQLLKLHEEKIRWFNLKLWGPKGEKLSPDQTLMLLEEASVTEPEVEQEAAQPPVAATATWQGTDFSYTLHLEMVTVSVLCARLAWKCDFKDSS